MGDGSNKPVTDEHNEHGSGNGLRYGVACVQKWQTRQIATFQVSDKLKGWSFFAVFNGSDFGGGEISAYCAEHLMKNIVNIEEGGSSDFADQIRSGFLNLDKTIRTVSGIGDSDCGTTAICAFITPEKIFIANCGHSRAVLCNSGEPIFGTQDHKPKLENEYQRIERAGGYVLDGLVKGYLSTSRGFGYYTFKAAKNLDQCEQMVSPEPEVTVRAREENDEFLVIACDGVWNVMKNNDICELIRSRLLVTDDLATIAEDVLETCWWGRCGGNTSIIIVTFPAAPTPSPEAIEKERILERDIERLIIKMITIPEMIHGNRDEDRGKEYEHVNVHSTTETLRRMQKYLTNLPPKGNIGTKQGFIERIFQQCYDRGNILRLFTDKTIDVLLDEDDGDIESVVGQVLDELNENSSPSGDNIDTKPSVIESLGNVSGVTKKKRRRRRKRSKISKRSRV